MALTRDFSSGKQFLIWCIKSCKNKNFLQQSENGTFQISSHERHFLHIGEHEAGDINELTQRDATFNRKKRTAKRLSVTNVTGPLFECFAAIFT